MQQGPSWAASSSSAHLYIRNTLWNMKDHYRVHNRPPLVPVLSQINLVYSPPFWSTSILILSTHLCFGLPTYFQPFPDRTPVCISLLPNVSHDPPMSFSLFLSSEYYLVRSTKRSINNITNSPVTSSGLIPYIMFRTNFRPSSACSLISMWQVTVHINTKAKYQLLYCNNHNSRLGTDCTCQYCTHHSNQHQCTNFPLL
jgi:hypothetical protein